MGLFNDLRQRGVWSGYEKYVVQLEPILEAMSMRGIPVPRAAWEDAKAKLEARRGEIVKAMQALVPAECLVHHPKQGYKKQPKDFVEGGATEHAGEPAVWGKRWFRESNEKMYLTTDLTESNILAAMSLNAPTSEERCVKLLP